MIANNHLRVALITIYLQQIFLAIIQYPITPSRDSILLAGVPSISRGIIFVGWLEVYPSLVELREGQSVLLLGVELIQWEELVQLETVCVGLDEISG